MLQTRRQIALLSPLGDDVLLFRCMSGREQLGALFDFRLALLSRDHDLEPDDILGQNATVRLELGGDRYRYFNGCVGRFCYVGSEGDFARYEASLRPWLWFLTRTSDCRIFQDQTVPQIVEAVCREHGFTDIELALSGDYAQREYCVQYRETDFAFISRLMEYEGMYYFFRHQKDKHTLVLADSVGAHQRAPGYEQIPYYPPNAVEARDEQYVSRWRVSYEVQPGACALNSYDFEKPRAGLRVRSGVSRANAHSRYEVYDYPGKYTDATTGEHYARARIEQLQSEYETAEGETTARGIATGGLFELTQYPRADQNREYLVVSATYELNSDDYASAAEGDSPPVYACRFGAIRSKQPYRPAMITPKPAVQGPQTAIVVGKAGEEIWTDGFGRIKVQFHWDRNGREDENSSCWIRVSHPWAGKGWGSVSIPRVGQEVIVDFLEGDPDRPIVTGRVYNADLMPPYDLPAGGMVSGLKSSSTPGGGGYNEISMNDTKGAELVTIHSQFDMDTTVQHDLREHVLNNRSREVSVDESLSVGNNRTLEVGVDQATTVGSNHTVEVGADHTESVGNDRTSHVGNNTKSTVGSHRSTSIGANDSLNVNGKRTVKVGANQSESIAGTATQTVGAAKSESIGAAKALSIGGAYQVSVGAAMNTTVGFVHAEQVGFMRKIIVGRKFELSCGAGKITVTRAGKITLEGTEFEFKSSGPVTINGSVIDLN